MTEQKTEEPSKTAEEGNSTGTPIPALRPNETPHPDSVQAGQTEQSHNLAQQINHTDHIIARSAIVTAVLTCVLAVLAGLQAYSFIESERAFLVLKDLSFLNGDPVDTHIKRDFFLVLRNVGKHIARIKELRLVPHYGAAKGSLPKNPDYSMVPDLVIVPPIAPGTDAPIVVKIVAKGERPPNALPEDKFVAGIMDGTNPLWVYGYVEYDIGYPWWRPGKLGFCMQFILPKDRVKTIGQFSDLPTTQLLQHSVGQQSPQVRLLVYVSSYIACFEGVGLSKIG